MYLLLLVKSKVFIWEKFWNRIGLKCWFPNTFFLLTGTMGGKWITDVVESQVMTVYQNQDSLGSNSAPDNLMDVTVLIILACYCPFQGCFFFPLSSLANGFGICWLFPLQICIWYIILNVFKISYGDTIDYLGKPKSYIALLSWLKHQLMWVCAPVRAQDWSHAWIITYSNNWQFSFITAY